MINLREWMGRDAALAKLGVRAQTLYAYVSRGRIGMRPDPRDPRRSLYRATDVLTLATKRARGRRPRSIAESAMAWGEPSIATALSNVAHGTLTYRGVSALSLAEDATLEDVAALLWELPAPPTIVGRAAGANPLVALASLAQQPSLGRARSSLAADATHAVGVLARALGVKPGEKSVHARLGLRGEDDVRRVLVLLADHELNASTFAARVAASTGAPIASCLLAGLATLSGPRHGRAAEALGSLVRDVDALGLRRAVRAWLGRDQPLPGFGHPLYPGGDPRATALLARIELAPTLSALRDAVVAETDALPNVDFALLALTLAHRWPTETPFRLFTLARSVGWAAHAIEQVTSGALIRPRATYVGLAGVARPSAP